MRDADRRPMGRLFYWALVFTMTIAGFRISVYGSAPQDSATTTTVADTVYMADLCMNASTWAKGEKAAASAAGN